MWLGVTYKNLCEKHNKIFFVELQAKMKIGVLYNK